MSFKYTIMIPSTMRFQKMLFIIFWKIARLLVIPKKHYQGFEKYMVYVKGCLLLMTGLDVDIFETSVYI